MLVKIGEIVKAQGITGEVKLKPFQSDYEYLKGLKLVHLNSCPHKLRSVSLRGGFAYVTFEGITDRSAAETLVGKTVEVDRRDMPATEEGEYYVGDIIGCKVMLKSGREIGTVKDIQNFGSADVYTVSGEKTVRFPFLKQLVIDIDTKIRMITLDDKVFGEVCVYED